jgi:3-dehydroquinate dehydratase-1
LICVPLVARTTDDLAAQATVACAVNADIIEWRADFHDDPSGERLVRAARVLRDAVDRRPIIFTLRMHEEGGARPLSAEVRSEIIASVLDSETVDVVDIELRNGPAFIGPIGTMARTKNTRLILSFHDFEQTPAIDFLLDQVSAMVQAGADIAKFACMPRESADVLRLLEATSRARTAFPNLPLCTMSMGTLGVPTRVAGFLFGSDMSFAVGQAASAPGQIPIAELRAMIDGLARYA